MTKEVLVTLAGLLLIVVPSLGIPDTLKERIVVGVGVMFMLVGYLLIRDRLYRSHDLGNGERESETFVETTGSLFESKDTKG